MKRYLAAVAVVLIFMAGMMLFAQPLGAQKPALQKRTTHGEYIDKYKDLAIEDMEVYGIPASITMAQGLLESDCGNSRLAVEANNHFGIKCKAEWTGQTISHDDDALGECFRKYVSAEASYRDHSEFLDKSPRYQALFDLEITDYKGWAHGLKAAGYATNPQYARLLIKLIEDHRLYLLDVEGGAGYLADVAVAREGAGTTPAAEAEKIDVDNYVVSATVLSGYPVYRNNGSEFVVARQGDTYGRLSKLFGVREYKLRKFNDAGLEYEPVAGSQVYIKAKLSRAANGKIMHIVKEGETLHSISQVYGVKLKKLVRLNRSSVGARLHPGQQIRLM